MRFAALGRTHWLFDAIESCVAAGHDCGLIATAEAAPEYRRDESALEGLAGRLGCGFFLKGRDGGEGDLRSMIVDADAAVAISINWPLRLDAALRGLFPYGVLNCHAGDVPRYRGNACPNWAILNGEEQIAVSLMCMDDGIDTGPVLLKETIPVSEDTYIFDLYEVFDRIVPAQFAKALALLDAGDAVFEDQPNDPASVLRCYPRRPEDGRLDWTASAVALARLVRASAEPFAGAFCDLESGEKLTVWRARAAEHPGPFCAVPGQVAALDAERGEVAVLAADGLLILEEVETPEHGRGPATNVIRSTRSRLG
jgi:methionyl-tRNA formyltransferase